MVIIKMLQQAIPQSTQYIDEKINKLLTHVQKFEIKSFSKENCNLLLSDKNKAALVAFLLCQAVLCQKNKFLKLPMPILFAIINIAFQEDTILEITSSKTPRKDFM